jgi:hypothetical protein
MFPNYFSKGVNENDEDFPQVRIVGCISGVAFGLRRPGSGTGCPCRCTHRSTKAN